MKPLRSSIAEKIRVLRKAAHPKMSQEKLGELVGVESMVVSRWERGINIPSATNLESLGKIFNRPASYFLDQGIDVIKVPSPTESMEKILEAMTALNQENKLLLDENKGLKEKIAQLESRLLDVVDVGIDVTDRLRRTVAKTSSNENKARALRKRR